MTRNPTTPYVLAICENSHIRLDLPLPKAEISAFELLPAVFELTDKMVMASCDDVLAMNHPVRCGAGCGSCCKQLVPISEYEAVHLADVVRSMEPSKRSRVVSRFTKAVIQLEQSGLLEDLTHVYGNEVTDTAKVLDVKKRYWELSIPCPFLEDESCSIHPDRPVACRQYLVTSAPSKCQDIYSDREAHEVVLHSMDIGGALASFSGEGIQPSRVMPHVLSLLAERGIRSRPAVMMPAERMMGRFLDLIAEGFTRHNKS
ncbi:YkgJ family cysteine cluster protein [Pseudodesulfovibrio sp. zrk46]|uniref:YkgJ family cysteine cluster protein n=1 Tax=Pseudodesulfovibrio sp. zrk46 TaxID=2725288 RepID=UPI001FFC4649|nr:YkgJ family cysteine cluster protein [Pseudodesulfovibrio sp. zrk46]